MLRRARPEHDDGHGEAGVEEHARGPGEHRNPADECGLLVHTEALAAAGSEQDDLLRHPFAWGGHFRTVAGRVPE